MDASEDKRQFAWQPLSPRGVAAFAKVSLGRLLVVQFVVACVSAGVMLWFLTHCWFPVVRQSIEKLPDAGQIRSGVLEWNGPSPILLAENHFLALTVDVSNSGLARSTAEVSLEFGRSGLRIYSLLGVLALDYPSYGSVGFNRNELLPWWGAWNPVFLAAAAALWVGGLMLTWWLLATIYCLPVGIAGFIADRDLNLRSSWRLSGAAVLPGALFFCGCILLYGLAYLDLIRLALGWAVHLVIGWIYAALAIVLTPRTVVSEDLPGNPFTPAVPETAGEPNATKSEKDPKRD